MITFNFNVNQNEFELVVDGYLPSTYQFHDCILINKKLIEDDNKKYFVTTSGSEKGNFLISDGIGPCQAVLFILKSNQFILYHAFSPFKSEPFNKVIDLAKGEEIEKIIVFQKSSPEKNLRKAPILATLLADQFKIDVTRIHVENHTTIVVDSKNKKIILAENVIYFSEQLVNNQNYSQETYEIDESKAIQMDKTIDEIIEIEKANQLPDHFKIPASFYEQQKIKKESEIIGKIKF